MADHSNENSADLSAKASGEAFADPGPAEPSAQQAGQQGQPSEEGQPFAESRAGNDLMVFHDVARALASSLDLDSILRAFTQHMNQHFEPECWSLLIADPVRGDLYYAIACGQATEPGGALRVAPGQGIAGWVAQRGEALILPAGADLRRLGELGIDPGPSPLRSAICIPLCWRRRVLGAIELLNCPGESVSDHTITFLKVLCDYAAVAIQNLRTVEKIQELTITDDCTGVYNARHLFAVLEREVERSQRFRMPCSAIFIDLDHFKRVNDAHGHLVGSRLLAEVAEILKRSVRGVDSVFRYGGDEFVILLPQTGKDAACHVARRLRSCVSGARFPVAAAPDLSIQGSFGIATFPEDGASARQIIEAADATMYLAKNEAPGGIAVAGRGCLREPR